MALRVEIEETIWCSHRTTCVICGCEYKHSHHRATLYDSEWEQCGHDGRVGTICQGCQGAGSAKASEIVREKALWLTSLADELSSARWVSLEELQDMDEKRDKEFVAEQKRIDRC